jgi:hypothetical protein
MSAVLKRYLTKMLECEFITSQFFFNFGFKINNHQSKYYSSAHSFVWGQLQGKITHCKTVGTASASSPPEVFGQGKCQGGPGRLGL